MDSFSEFEDLPTILPVSTVRYSGMLSLSGAGGDSGMGGFDIKQLEDIILARFLSRDSYARSFLGTIGTGERCRVKPCLVSGKGVTLKHYGVEIHGSRKWDLPPHEEEFLIPGRGDSIYINPFLLMSELLSDIVAILECTKRTESGMRTFSQTTSPQNQEENPDPHEPKVLFLGTSGKKESAGQSNIRNL